MASNAIVFALVALAGEGARFGVTLDVGEWKVVAGWQLADLNPIDDATVH